MKTEPRLFMITLPCGVKGEHEKNQAFALSQVLW